MFGFKTPAEIQQTALNLRLSETSGSFQEWEKSLELLISHFKTAQMLCFHT